jgi:hypothetical protein
LFDNFLTMFLTADGCVNTTTPSVSKCRSF